MSMLKLQGLIFFLLLSCNLSKKIITDPTSTVWIKGSSNCKETTVPPIQVVKYNANTWILRQSKCTNYEGPFMYLFIGKKKALLMDTGATPDENKFPLYRTVDSLLTLWKNEHHITLQLIVAHTHGHGDHIAADKQFKDKPSVTLVGTGVDAIQDFFGLQNWPLKPSQFDLGDRVLDIIPIPGHQQAAIAVYDRATKILLTGDSFYPGRLYIKDWPAFALSTQRLVDFTSTHQISFILGNHIEMTKTPGKDYPAGTVFSAG